MTDELQGRVHEDSAPATTRSQGYKPAAAAHPSKRTVLMLSNDTVQLEPIGIVRSPLTTAVGGPLQPRMASRVAGTIEVEDWFQDGLRDLDGFSRIWVLYWFHQASSTRLVVTPYRDNVEHGVFATRVPARPNAIGMSCVSLLGVERNVLSVGDLDILNGTPVLDIKPYVPEYDSYPSEQTGWLARASRLDVRTGDGRFQKKSP